MPSKTRERLIEVARQLFAIKGVAQTTMNDIANASARGRRTIYMYFKNKKEIYNAVIESESDHLVNSLSRIMELDIPADEKLARFLHVRLERYTAPTASASNRQWLKFDSRRLEKVRLKAREKEEAMLFALLDEGIREGIFSPLRCKLLRGFINTAMKFEDNQPPGEADMDERRSSIECFIEFIITDIKRQ